MSDRIEGVAILDETSKPARLHFVCVKANGDRRPWADSIPVRPAGTPEIPGTISWEFAVHGDGRLEMKPSVKMSHALSYTNDVPPQPIWTEYFHNDGLWWIPFERWVRRPEFENENGGDVDHSAIWERMKELNPALLTREHVFLHDAEADAPPPAPAPVPALEENPTAPPVQEHPLSGYQLSVVRRRMEQHGETEAQARAAVTG